MSQLHDSGSPSSKRSRMSSAEVKEENGDCKGISISVVDQDMQMITKNKSHLLNELDQLNQTSSSKFLSTSPDINDKTMEITCSPNIAHSISQSSSHYQRFVHIPAAKTICELKKVDSVSSSNIDATLNQIHQNKEIAERAKQEANVLQRIFQLRKLGLWSATRLPVIMEAKRRKSHWDYLLDEMEWITVDFIEERKWKIAAAKKLADAAQKYLLAKEERIKIEQKEAERHRQILAYSTSNIVNDWLHKIKERRESLISEGEYQYMDLLSRRSDRMIDQLTDSCPQWFEDAANSECMLSGQDEDFVLPTSDIIADSDSSFSESWEDKSLPSEEDQWWQGEKNAESEEAALKMEIRSLKEDGDLPLADLLQNIPMEILSKPSQLVSLSSSSTLDYQNEVDELRTEVNLSLDDVLERYYGVTFEDLTEPPTDFLLSDSDDVDESESSDESSVSSEKESFISAESTSMAFHVESDRYSNAADIQSMANKVRLALHSNNVKPIVQPSTLCTKSSIDLPADHITALKIMTSFYQENLPLLLLNCQDAGESDPLLVFYLAHLATSEAMWGPSLVVLPSSSLIDWRIRCMKIAPGLKVAIYSNNDNDELCHPWKMSETHICLASYTDLRQNCEYFTNHKWKVVICDQIHLLINEPNLDSDSTKSKQLIIEKQSFVEESVEDRISLLNKVTCCGQRIFVASWTDLTDLTVSESSNLLKLLLLYNACPESQSWTFPGDVVSKLVKKSIDCINNQDEEEFLEEIHKFLDPFVCRLDDEFEKQVEEHVILAALSTKQFSLFNQLRDSSKSQSTQKSGHLLDLLDVVKSARQVSCHPYLLESPAEVVPVISPLVFPLNRQEPLMISLPGQIIKAAVEFRNQQNQILLPRLLSPMSKDLGKFVRERVFQLRPCPGMIEELANVDPSTNASSTPKSSVQKAFLSEEDHQQLSVERSQSLHNHSSSRSTPSQVYESIIEIRLDNNGLSRHHMSGTHISVTNGAVSVDSAQFNGNLSPNKQTVPGTTRPTFSNTTLAARRTRTLLKSRLTSLNRENERRCCLLQDSTQWINSELREMLTIENRKERFLREYSFESRDAMLPRQYMDSIASRCVVPIIKAISFPPVLNSPCKSCYKESLINDNKLMKIKPHLNNLWAQTPLHLLTFPSFHTVRENSGKLWILDQLLDQILMKQGHKLVLLSHMEEFLDLIEYWIISSPILRSIPRARIDGQVELMSRYAAIERFNALPDNRPFVLLLGGRTGEIGLNLLMPSTIIVVDVDWRPEVEDLLKTRLYRWALNSRSFSHKTHNLPPLKVFRLLSERTVEDYLFNHQGSRLLMQTVYTEKSATQPLVQARVQPNIIQGFLRGVGRVFETSGPGSTIADDLEEDQSCADSEQSNRVVSHRLDTTAMSQSVAYFQRKVNLSEAAVERAVELFESPRDIASWCRLEGELKNYEAEIKGSIMPDNSSMEMQTVATLSPELPLIASMNENEDEYDEVKNYWSAIERWEVQQYARNSENEARRTLLEEDDAIVTYRHDFLKDYLMKSNSDDTEMPTYCLSFDIREENDYYIDPSHIMCYEPGAMQEEDLPPISLIPSPPYVNPPARINPATGRVNNALARKRDLSWMRRRGQLANRGEGTDDLTNHQDNSFEGDQNFHPGTPKRRKLTHSDKLRGMNTTDAAASVSTVGSDNPACYGGSKGAPMKGKFDKTAPGYGVSSSSSVNSGVENRLVTVTLVGNNSTCNQGQMRVQVTKPFYLRDVGNKNKLRRHCLQPGFPMSLQHQRLGLQGGLRLGAGALSAGTESTSAYLMSKRPEFQAHEEAALYHSISQLQGLPFDLSAAERSPTAQTFLPNFQLGELYLNDYVGTQCYRGTLQLAFYYDKMQNQSFHQSGPLGMSSQGQGGVPGPGFGPVDSAAGESVEPGTPGRKLKNKHKSPSINRFQGGNYGANLGTGNAFRGDACSGEVVLSSVIKSTLQKLVKRRMAGGAVNTVSTIKGQGSASGAAGTNTALANSSSMTTSAMIQKNPTHIQTLQDLNINPEQLTTPAIVLRNKEDREEKERLNKLATASNNPADGQQQLGLPNQQAATILQTHHQFPVQTSNSVTVLQATPQSGGNSNIGLQGGCLVGSRLVASNAMASAMGGQQATMAGQSKVGGAVSAGLSTVAVGQVNSVPQRFMSGRQGASILVSSSNSVAAGGVGAQGLSQIQQHTYKRSVPGSVSNVIATTSRVGGGGGVQHGNSSVTRHLITTGANVSGTQRIQLPTGSASTGGQITQQIVSGTGASVRQGIITQGTPGQIYAQMTRQNSGGPVIKRGAPAPVNRIPGVNQLSGTFTGGTTVRGGAPQGARVQRPNAPASINTTILRQRGQGNSHVLKKTPSGAGVVYNNLQIISSGSGVSSVVGQGNVVNSGGVSISGQAAGGLATRGNISTTTVTAQQIQQLILSGHGVVMANASTAGQAVSGSLASLTGQSGSLQSQAQQRHGVPEQIIISRVNPVPAAMQRQNPPQQFYQQKNPD